MKIIKSRGESPGFTVFSTTLFRNNKMTRRHKRGHLLPRLSDTVFPAMRQTVPPYCFPGPLSDLRPVLHLSHYKKRGSPLPYRSDSENSKQHNDEIKRWRRLTLSRCVPLIVYSGAQREQNAPLVIPAGIKNPHPRTRLTYSRSSDQQFLIYAWEERIIFSPWPQLWGNLPFPGAGSQLIHRGYHIVRVRFPRKRP